MPAPKNLLKFALARGDVQHGLWLALASASVAELAGGAGLDWCLIDAEHGPNTLTTIQAQLQALAAQNCPAVVRVPAGDEWILKQVLDLGCQSVLVPLVHSAEEARAAASAVRYPPQGARGMGAALARASDYSRITDYVATANDQICLLVQAESAAAIEAIDDIAAVDGVDGVFIGPADLSADMGYPGRPDAPEVERAIDHAITRITAAGKAAGIITFDPNRFAEYREKGVTFLGVGGDATILSDALARLRTDLS
ncbi:HpcH/HpaI aldolase family protein [Aestuariibius sp. 2305UL40-4]|uniref:HpcH/HpaI aldolase family protein n=1 Tax=Aestuariibius violaceus TaxID=3234132 RepID=UPI00345E13A7